MSRDWGPSAISHGSLVAFLTSSYCSHSFSTRWWYPQSLCQKSNWESIRYAWFDSWISSKSSLSLGAGSRHWVADSIRCGCMRFWAPHSSKRFIWGRIPAISPPQWSTASLKMQIKGPNIWNRRNSILHSYLKTSGFAASSLSRWLSLSLRRLGYSSAGFCASSWAG
jgi:hypothetical protein